MSGFGSFSQGLASGVNTALNVAQFKENKKRYADQAERQAKRDKMEAERFNLEKMVRLSELEDLADDRERTKKLRSINALEWMMESGQVDPSTMNHHMNIAFGNWAKSNQYPGGEKNQFADAYLSEDGQNVFFEVETPSGVKPLTAYRSREKDDPVVGVPVSAMFQHAQDMKGLINALNTDPQAQDKLMARIQAQRAALGDDSFLQALRESKAKQAERAHEMALEDKKIAGRMQQEKYRQGAVSGRQRAADKEAMMRQYQAHKYREMEHEKGIGRPGSAKPHQKIAMAREIKAAQDRGDTEYAQLLLDLNKTASPTMKTMLKGLEENYDFQEADVATKAQMIQSAVEQARMIDSGETQSSQGDYDFEYDPASGQLVPVGGGM